MQWNHNKNENIRIQFNINTMNHTKMYRTVIGNNGAL